VLLILCWLLLATAVLGAEESFITPGEYASQLYHNPRGIGCDLCHGEAGEGKVIAHYKAKGKPRTFTAPAINALPFERFDKALDRHVTQGRTIEGMPKYYLTRGERKILYFYLHPTLLKKENNVSK